MKNNLLLILLIISFVNYSKADSVNNYKEQFKLILTRSQHESLMYKKKTINEIGKKLETDISKSTYPTSEFENEEMSWKVEVATGISLLDLKQLSLERCEKVKIKLQSQLNSPSIETESNPNATSEQQKIIQNILEYLCYE